MSNNSNNVVSFPKGKNANKDITLEDIQHNMEMMRHYHIQETIQNLVPMIFNQLDIAGFGLIEDDVDVDVKDGALIVEALRSLMLKHYDMHHPFQQVSEAIFVPHPKEEGAFKIADKLELDLKPLDEPEETE
jgi:hypothetical protein